jgi:hypothetical protein
MMCACVLKDLKNYTTRRGHSRYGTIEAQSCCVVAVPPACDQKKHGSSDTNHAHMILLSQKILTLAER